eukprot:Gregarina_sp_Pseudo_9__1368@NODE_1916_length_1254_cov_414_950617_g1777_i0_p2_GENE_NODE_1916_length_1254_cov_414_950617_g1777_i0NODE_1916_length_1254_cov_414_950617_g1777_i0_p2_ORF_typecomplete_len107_score9_29_NODE_1916_length_1254_cov_414_950617_g1777_i07311051
MLDLQSWPMLLLYIAILFVAIKLAEWWLPDFTTRLGHTTFLPLRLVVQKIDTPRGRDCVPFVAHTVVMALETRHRSFLQLYHLACLVYQKPTGSQEEEGRRFSGRN